MNNIFRKKILVYAVGTIAIIYLLFEIVYSIFFAGIGCDSGYYLQAIEYVNKGMMPYSDFQFGYTPGLFIFAPIKSMLGLHYCYTFDMAFFWVLELLCSLLVYKLCRLMSISKNYSIAAFIFFSIVAVRADGASFLLEIPSVLCGLGALYLILSRNNWWSLLLAGIGAGLAFMFKQYGLGFFVLCIYAILISQSKRFKSISIYTLGFLLVMGIAYYIFGDGLVSLFINSNYRGFDSVDADLCSKLLLMGKIYIKFLIPIVIFLPVALFGIPRDILFEHKWKLLLLLFGILGFALQFYFGAFAHYGMYNLPFITIAIFFVLQNIAVRKFKILWAVLIVLNILYCIALGIKGHVHLNNSRVKQEFLAEKLKQFVRDGETVLTYDNELMCYYYIADLIPPCVEKYGLSFGNEAIDRIHEQITQTDYVLKTQDAYMFTSEFDEEFNAFQLIEIDKYQLFKRVR